MTGYGACGLAQPAGVTLLQEGIKKLKEFEHPENYIRECPASALPSPHCLLTGPPPHAAPRVDPSRPEFSNA